MVSWREDYPKLNVMKRCKPAEPIKKEPEEVVSFNDLKQLNTEKLEMCNKSSCKLLNYANTSYKKFPMIRLINLNRVSGNFKCQRIIDFEEAESLKETVYDDEGNEKTLIYSLKAIVNHHGAYIDAGHYTAYCKRAIAEIGDDRWVHFDDELVTMIDPNDET